MAGFHLSRVYGLPRFTTKGGGQRPDIDISNAAMNNQFGLAHDGSTDLFLNGHSAAGPNVRKNVTIWVTYVDAAAVFNINDRDGVNIFTGLAALTNWEHQPLRFDGGIIIPNGVAIRVIKGFYEELGPAQ